MIDRKKINLCSLFSALLCIFLSTQVYSSETLTIQGKLTTSVTSFGQLNVIINGTIVNPPRNGGGSRNIFQNSFTAVLKEGEITENCDSGKYTIESSDLLNSTQSSEFYVAPVVKSIVCNDDLVNVNDASRESRKDNKASSKEKDPLESQSATPQ